MGDTVQLNNHKWLKSQLGGLISGLTDNDWKEMTEFEWCETLVKSELFVKLFSYRMTFASFWEASSIYNN